MKSLLVLFTVFAGILCFGETTFEVKFPAKEFKPKAKQNVIFNKITIGPKNFVAGPGKDFAFCLSDENAKAKKPFRYYAGNNISLPKGSFEVTFKILKRLPKTGVRLIHVYSPVPKSKEILIYYASVTPEGNMMFIIQVNRKQYRVRIPGREFDASKFNTFKLTWNAKMMACYLNGELIEDCALPPEFAGIAAKKRSWSTLEILPVFTGMKDSWENRVAVSSLIFKDTDK